MLQKSDVRKSYLILNFTINVSPAIWESFHKAGNCYEKDRTLFTLSLSNAFKDRDTFN